MRNQKQWLLQFGTVEILHTQLRGSKLLLVQSSAETFRMVIATFNFKQNSKFKNQNATKLLRRLDDFLDGSQPRIGDLNEPFTPLGRLRGHLERHED